jgi:hypothetical protein
MMVKTWNIVLEVEDGTELSLTGIDAKDIIGIATLNSRYIAALKWNLENKPHYKAIGRVKSLESSAGDKPDINTVGFIRATAANDDVKMGFFFIKAAKGSLQVIALWPDDYASACKVKKELYNRFVVSLVQSPTFYAEVSIVLPKT